jgi:hypothetical protein
MSELIPAALIERLRVSVDEASMPDVCTITSVVIGDDGGGGQTRTETTATSICTLVPRSGREVSGDQLREQGDYKLFVPVATVIGKDSKVTHESGRVFQVVFTPPLTNYSTSREVGLRDA